MSTSRVPITIRSVGNTIPHIWTLAFGQNLFVWVLPPTEQTLIGGNMGATGMLCVSTHDAVTKECVAPVSNNTFVDSTENVPSATPGSPELCRPPGGSCFHTKHATVHCCFLLAEVHSVLLGIRS
jgi:hypothetical protein